MAADHIELGKLSDRELLLITAQKVNDIDDKVDAACGTLDEHNGKFADMDKRITLVEDRECNNKKIIFGIISGIVAMAGGIVYVVLQHIGLSK